MKLRIKGNSIRLRLLKSEVERFGTVGRITDQTSFGAGVLRYSLVMSHGAETVYAEFHNNEIRVLVPETAGRDWAADDSVGFRAEQVVGDNEILSILVEKDFACLDRPDDPDREDAFPNPNSDCTKE